MRRAGAVSSAAESREPLQLVLHGLGRHIVGMQLAFQAGPRQGLGEPAHLAQQVDPAEPCNAPIGRDLLVQVKERQIVFDHVLQAGGGLGPSAGSRGIAGGAGTRGRCSTGRARRGGAAWGLQRGILLQSASPRLMAGATNECAARLLAQVTLTLRLTLPPAAVQPRRMRSLTHRAARNSVTLMSRPARRSPNSSPRFARVVDYGHSAKALI